MNYVTTGVIFEEIMQKLANRENYASEEIKCRYGKLESASIRITL